MKKSLIFLMVFLLGIFVFSFAAEVITVEIMWEAGETQGWERDLLEILINEFEMEHPNIKIKNNPFVGSAEDYQAKLLARLSAGAGPDLFTVGDNTLFQYVKAGLVAPVPTELSAQWEADLYPNMKEGIESILVYDGQFYGAPWNSDYISLYYNKDMFEEAGLTKPPSNLEELRDYAIKLTKRDEKGQILRSGICIRANGGAGTTDKFINFLTAMGGDIFNEDLSECIINNEAGVAALEYYVNLLYEDKVDSLILQPRDKEAFAVAKTAMFGREPFVMTYLKDAAPDLNYGVAPFPGKSTVFVDALCVNAASQKKEAAWTFVKWLLQPEVFGRWQEGIGSIPLFQSVAERPFYYDNENMRAFSEQPLWKYPPLKNFYEMKVIIGDYIEEACYKKLTPQEAFDRAAREVNSLLLEERR